MTSNTIIYIYIRVCTVLRTTYETHYFHPKECVVKDGCCSEALAAIKLKSSTSSSSSSSSSATSGRGSLLSNTTTTPLGDTSTNGVRTERKSISGNNNNTTTTTNATNKKISPLSTVHANNDIDIDHEMLRCSLTVVVPYATCLSVTRPARTLMDTGSVSYPIHKPIIAARDYIQASNSSTGTSNNNGKGRVIVISSCAIFEDAWLDKEDNNKVMEFAFKFLKPGSTIDLGEYENKHKSSSMVDMSDELSDAHESDVNTPLPDTASLATRLRCCLQESEELPSDFRTLFDTQQFSFNFNCVPDAVELYDKLNVKHAPLTLIPPQFETYVFY